MADTKQDRPRNTQTARRIKYGLNVSVAVLVAIALVVLVNWIAYRRYVRWDFTSTREYSLSQQTERVLDSLEGEYQIVTLFSSDIPYLREVRDLIDEYDRRARQVSAQHIVPGRDFGQEEAFYRLLQERYADDIAPVAEAIDDARATLRDLADGVAATLPSLTEAANHEQLGEGDLKEFLGSVVAAFTRFGSNLDTLDEQVQELLDEPLPDYARLRSDLRSRLQQLDDAALSLAVERFRRSVDEPNVPDDVKERLLVAGEQLEAIRKQVRDAIRALGEAPELDRYTRVRTELLANESVVVLGPEQVRVIPASDMYRQPDPQIVQQTGDRSPQFLGEERLTGTLVAMRMPHPPMVVFVVSGQTAALGPRGQYQGVAERLRRANFEVQEWNPTAQFGPMGQPTPPRPRPEPAPGQKALWIVLPQPPDNPMNPMMGGGKEQIAELLDERLAAGDGAMVMLSANPMGGFGATDPIVQTLQVWGINPQLDRVVLREIQLPNRQTRVTTQHEVTDWPEDTPITKALRGTTAMFLQTCPLTLGETGGDATEQYPLVELTGDRLWAHTDLMSPDAVQNAEYDPETAAERFVVAAAAENDTGRLIVVADPIWASDMITQLGYLGEGTAAFTGAVYPGNSELFMNSAYWLAGLDELIAASPRTQDIRRIEALDHTTMALYRWVLLAGLPVACAAAGIGVWFVRRRV